MNSVPVTPDVDVHEEQRLAEAVRDGDRESFRILYERNVDAVGCFLANRVPYSEVDDLVADVFLRAWKARASYENRGFRYISWLLRIATNLVISKSRRPIKEHAGLDGHDRQTEDPMERVVDQLAGSAMRDVLASLPERQRTVLELRFIEDLNSTDVGEIMGLSPEAVRQLSVRALRQVRSLLSDVA